MSSEVDSSSVSSSKRTGLRDINHVRSPAAPESRSSTSIDSLPCGSSISGQPAPSMLAGRERIVRAAPGRLRHRQSRRRRLVDQDESAVLVLHGQADRQELDDALDQVAVALRLALAFAQPVELKTQFAKLGVGGLGIAQRQRRQCQQRKLPREDQIGVVEGVLAGRSKQNEHPATAMRANRKVEGRLRRRDQVAGHVAPFIQLAVAARRRDPAARHLPEEPARRPSQLGQRRRHGRNAMHGVLVLLQHQRLVEIESLP